MSSTFAEINPAVVQQTNKSHWSAASDQILMNESVIYKQSNGDDDDDDDDDDALIVFAEYYWRFEY